MQELTDMSKIHLLPPERHVNWQGKVRNSAGKRICYLVTAFRLNITKKCKHHCGIDDFLCLIHERFPIYCETFGNVIITTK